MSYKISFNEAFSFLLKGEVVALPTETVYGLAGRIDKEKTIKKIFELKKRPFFNPLIVHFSNKEKALESISEAYDIVEQLFDFFSPGPLTIVAKKNKNISSLVSGGKNTVALRIPQHPLIRNLLKNLPAPLAAPSANLYTQVSPVTADQVLESFPKGLYVLDGGRSKEGLESTVLFPDMERKKFFILRPGMITKEEIIFFLKKKNLNFIVEYEKDSSQMGGQKSHYKVQAPLYVVQTKKNSKEIKLFFLNQFPNFESRELILSDCPKQTARDLYTQMRDLSKGGKKILIFVKKKEKQSGSLWQGVWDRLEKASSDFFNIP